MLSSLQLWRQSPSQLESETCRSCRLCAGVREQRSICFVLWLLLYIGCKYTSSHSQDEGYHRTRTKIEKRADFRSFCAVCLSAGRRRQKLPERSRSLVSSCDMRAITNSLIHQNIISYEEYTLKGLGSLVLSSNMRAITLTAKLFHQNIISYEKYTIKGLPSLVS